MAEVKQYSHGILDQHVRYFISLLPGPERLGYCDLMKEIDNF